MNIATWTTTIHLIFSVHLQLQYVHAFSLSGPGRTDARNGLRISQPSNKHILLKKKMPFDGRDRENILKHLFMQPSPPLDDENRKGLIVGTVVTERYLYRFSPTKSAVQTPYTIEERQHFRVLEDKSLECLGEKSVIFRGAGNQDGTGNPLDHGSFSKDYTKIGPALYAVEGMHNSSTDKIRSSKEPGNKTNLVMALYCMEHPEVFKGRGLEVGR